MQAEKTAYEENLRKEQQALLEEVARIDQRYAMK
jgi:hypothetical protein